MSRMKVSSSHDRLHVCRTISLLERHLKETVSSSLLIESEVTVSSSLLIESKV